MRASAVVAGSDDGGPRPEAGPPFEPGRTVVRRRWSWTVFLVALVAMVAMYHSTWADPAHRTLGSVNHTNDPMQMMWFLKWVPWALLHGHNPFHTSVIFYPQGVSLTWNTYVPTLGLAAAPLTLTAGAAVSFVVLMTLGPALTALTGFWWLRRHTRRPEPAAVGAFLLAFNPFVAGHMLGHLNLVFLPLIPLVLMLTEDLLWRRPRPTRTTAVYLGVVAGLQMGISEEILLIVLVEVIVALAVAGCVMPRETARSLAGAWPGIAVAAGTFLVVAGPQLVAQLLLSPSVAVATQRFGAVAGDYVHPHGRQVVSRGRFDGHLGGAEGGVYLGWVVIAVLVVGLIMTWRDRRVRTAGVVLALSILLTFGTEGLDVDWLPGRILARLPALESIVPARFAFGSFVILAWLASVWLDRLREHGTTSRRRHLRGATALALVSALVVTFLPRPVGSRELPARVPFLGSAQERLLLGDGAPILMFPAPYPGDASGMYYQQQANFQFALPSGYALTPPELDRHNAAARQLRQFLAAQAPGAQDVPAVPIEDVRRAVRTLRLRALVVILRSPDAARWLELARLLQQRPSDLTTGGVEVWLVDGPS